MPFQAPLCWRALLIVQPFVHQASRQSEKALRPSQQKIDLVEGGGYWLSLHSIIGEV